ncbi:MAG: glycosyl hydrolase family 18 protein [Edaphobacter sp.]|uniref:glycosyl hydrolase family 18 protein n=1 Tax=Edaphobacter sp. TaxID=1934404 RepID=UPI0023850BAB|nr:glycosyl hydrolase family 18 protein [Edaphobacter sp.]MDE1176831.1 glycosyl hydrolase family 18 protein [Edaphobacter sp.]
MRVATGLGLLGLMAASMGSLRAAVAQGTVPTFTQKHGAATLTMVGGDPAKGNTTTIPTVIAPVRLEFESKKVAGKPFAMDAAGDVAPIERSPVFAKFRYGKEAPTQYADAMLRATFPKEKNWHTELAKPRVKPVTVTVPAGYGYVLESKSTGTYAAIVDLEFVQQEVFKKLPKQDGALVFVVTHNTAFYAMGDATVCCSWGTHGVDRATGNSFVLASYLRNAPAVITDKDAQPLTQQLAEFVNDPLMDPLFQRELYEKKLNPATAPGNAVSWMRPEGMKPGDGGRCGGNRVASTYFQLEPTDTNPKNNFPASQPQVVHGAGGLYHVQNVALMPWYVGAAEPYGKAFSFPDATMLGEPAKACPERRPGAMAAAPKPTEEPFYPTAKPNGHKLIGYWSGYGAKGTSFSLREVSPQWDYILVAFATPDKTAPEGTMTFRTPPDFDTEQFKSDIAWLKGKGKKVMISLGGGGQHFTLADPKRVPTYVASVEQIVAEYGFDGIDIDFESPSLSIDAGDTDFRHPTTPSIVNLIDALRQLHDHFGKNFMISLVPEGTQIPAGYPSYGGQFGSYLAITYAIRDILTFIDVQDYNTPPLQGLDGEIYQPGTVDYHAAMTELLLHGFNVGGDPKMFFPAVPAKQVAVGFLTGDTTSGIVDQAMDYIITGKRPEGVKYRMRSAKGYPEMIGAMFWTIDADRRLNYVFSNSVGPQLHGYPPSK